MADLSPATRAAFDAVLAAVAAYKDAVAADPAADATHTEYASVTAPARLGEDIVVSVVAYCRAPQNQEG